MKIKVIHIKLALVLALLGCVLLGQAQCKKHLLTYFNKIGSITKTENGKGSHFSIINRVTFSKELGSIKNESALEIIIVGKRMRYDSDLMSVYQDEKDRFVFIHTQKMVVWSEVNVDDNQAELTKGMIAFQDSLINSSTEVACNLKKVGKDSIWVGAFEIHNTFREKYNVNRVLVEISNTTHHLKKTTMFYLPNEEGIKEKEVEYKVMDYNYRGKLPHNIRDMVLTKDNGLIKKYAEYQLIDERNAKVSN